MSNKVIFILGFAVVSLLVYTLIARVAPTTSTNILYLTQPVNSFTGIVEAKSGNTITVSQTVSQANSKSVKLTYTFLVTNNTSFLNPPVSIPYLFTTPAPLKENKLGIEDVQVGGTVTVAVKTDLRLLQSTTIEAYNIFLSTSAHNITGSIRDITEKSLTLKTLKGDILTVNLTNKTEISRYVFTPNKPNEPPLAARPEKMNISDLKTGMQATIYIAEDVLTNKSVTALRVEPIIAPVVQAEPLISMPAPSVPTPAR
jgi:hypothetical protein